MNFFNKMLIIKFILALILFLLVHLWIRQRSSYYEGQDKDYKYETCILTRIKDTAYLLPQWIEYHLYVGFDRIFISSDCSLNQDELFWANFYSHLGEITFYDLQEFNNCSDKSRKPKEYALIHDLYIKAKDVCKWITVIDVDEYISPVKNNIKYNKFIKSILSSHSTPIYRMPWYVMSTNGLETRPVNTFIIDAFKNGQFKIPWNGNRIIIKTFIQSVLTADWNSSHVPKLRKDIKHGLFNHFSYQKKSNSIYARPNEMTVISSNCLQPTSPLYIRHFMGLSWNDYVIIRQSRMLDSDGNLNPWKGRHMWLLMNFTETESCKFNSARINTMQSQQLSESIRSNVIEKLRRYQVSGVPKSLESMFSCWLNGLKLQ